MRRVCFAIAAVSLSGCFDYEAFQRSQAREFCEWADRCDWMSEDTVGECYAENTEDLYANATCENFNAEAARSCLEEMGEIDCFDFGDILDLDVCAGVCPD
ncbi:MAG: hypothetical protein VXW32_02080 [Myxococcota bacterium]|nr:hypothetical protein [Myxococcota bacterium]